MRRRIDAARQAGYDEKPPPPEHGADVRGKFESGGGRLPRSDNGKRRAGPNAGIAFDIEQRRRHLDARQERWICRFARGGEPHACRFGFLQLGIDRCLGGDAARRNAAAKFGELRQCFERRLRGPEMREQPPKRHAANMRGADQPQPGASGLFAERRRGFRRACLFGLDFAVIAYKQSYLRNTRGKSPGQLALSFPRRREPMLAKSAGLAWACHGLPPARIGAKISAPFSDIGGAAGVHGGCGEVFPGLAANRLTRAAA